LTIDHQETPNCTAMNAPDERPEIELSFEAANCTPYLLRKSLGRLPNAAHLQLHAFAYNLGNFMRTLAMPKRVEQWSLTGLREKLIKIGARA
jgi:hypothetical protein